jgi:hypothetical protein
MSSYYIKNTGRFNTEMTVMKKRWWWFDKKVMSFNSYASAERLLRNLQLIKSNKEGER